MEGRLVPQVKSNLREAAKGADYASDAKAFAPRVAANQQILQAGGVALLRRERLPTAHGTRRVCLAIQYRTTSAYD
jgi:hypothetical protein